MDDNYSAFDRYGYYIGYMNPNLDVLLNSTFGVFFPPLNIKPDLSIS